jgi:hypothetical protein
MLTWAMHLTLCLPGLLLPRQALHDTVYDFSAPALSRLLGRGRRTAMPPGSLDDWLAARWGWSNLPVAPLRLAGEGIAPGEHDWLCLDPVHLKVGRDGVRLDAAGLPALDAEEDAALRAAIAPLFAEAGELVGGGPGRWYLRLTSPVALTTAVPVPGQGVDPGLPGGADGPRWRRLLAEAQMTLHAHAVNRRREDAGLPAINSLWPWGAGRNPRAPAVKPCAVLYAEAPLLRGLAVIAGVAPEAVPSGFTALPRHGDAVLIVLDDLAAPALALDAIAWREALARIEQHWFAPLAEAIAAGRCRLTLVAPGLDAGLELTVGRGDLWRFWRRPKPLAELAP